MSRAFGKRVKEILGDSPDIVFEHVGQATFPTSVFVVKPFGKVVICAGTTGYNLDFDVRYLWMRQKQIIGSHFANAYECMKANELIESGEIRPVLWRTMGFEGVAEAHQTDAREQAPRARSRSSSAPSRGARARRPRARARSARRSARDRRAGRSSVQVTGSRTRSAATSSPRLDARPPRRCWTSARRGWAFCAPTRTGSTSSSSAMFANKATSSATGTRSGSPGLHDRSAASTRCRCCPRPGDRGRRADGGRRAGRGRSDLSRCRGGPSSAPPRSAAPSSAPRAPSGLTTPSPGRSLWMRVGHLMPLVVADAGEHPREGAGHALEGVVVVVQHDHAPVPTHSRARTRGARELDRASPLMRSRPTCMTSISPAHPAYDHTIPGRERPEPACPSPTGRG